VVQTRRNLTFRYADGQSPVYENFSLAIEPGERRIAQLGASYRAQLQGERIESEAQISRLTQELAKLRHRQGLSELRAPAHGVVKDLATHTPGAVLAPGTVLMTLVPEGEALVAEVWLANQDAGFVASGQIAKLKLAERTVLEYLLSPVQKVAHEAGRER